jgi:hypothetical protein
MARFFMDKQVKKMDVVLFDCEATTDNQRLCAHVGVEHYPSVLFVGYGSYRRNDPVRRRLLGKKAVPERTVMYTGDLYFESVRDWVRTMRFFSRLSRLFGRAARLLGYGKEKEREEAARLDTIRAENAALKASAAASAAETQKRASVSQQSAKLTQKYATKHDAFRYLSDRGYGVANTSVPADLTAASMPATTKAGTDVEGEREDESTGTLTAIKRCVAETTSQHCEAQGDERAEPFCAKIATCQKHDFASLECRPATCPLHQEGCDFASICLNTDIIQVYAKQIAQEDAAKARLRQLKGATAGATTGVPASAANTATGTTGAATLSPEGGSGQSIFPRSSRRAPRKKSLWGTGNGSSGDRGDGDGGSSSSSSNGSMSQTEVQKAEEADSKASGTDTKTLAERPEDATSASGAPSVAVAV